MCGERREQIEWMDKREWEENSIEKEYWKGVSSSLPGNTLLHPIERPNG